ncbi:hypothetical protein, partial [Moorena sp. SIO1F2]|uniref:hypothetical protein n=1 Tax=Moorena sp. SIO1F2 TaxID=2607819 RepID=UPI0025F4DCE9
SFVSGFIKHTLTLPLKFFESRQVGDILTRVQETGLGKRFMSQKCDNTQILLLLRRSLIL